MIFVLGISKDRIPAKQVTWRENCELAKCQQTLLVNREDSHVLESCFDAEVICSQANQTAFI